MDLRKVTQLGYATCAQIPHKENLGFKIFEVAGIFKELSKSGLETILQLPRGLEIKPNGSILSVERLYTNTGHYLIFFVEYGFADFEQTTGGRPCFYAGAVGYVFEGRNPNAKELLDFLYLVTENAKQQAIFFNKEPAKITLPKFFSAQTQIYKYAPSDAKMRGYLYLPNIEEQKFGFVELAYGKNFETYQRIFGISSQEIINDIKDRSILDLGLVLSQANITTEKETSFLENIAQTEPTKTEDNKEILKDLQKEDSALNQEITNSIEDKSISDLRLTLPQSENTNIVTEQRTFLENDRVSQIETESTKINEVRETSNKLQIENNALKNTNESLNQEVKRLFNLNTEQNEIILQIRKQQSEKPETEKNTINLRLALTALVGIIIFLVIFIVYKIIEPTTIKSETQPNQEQLFDSINVLNRTINTQLREKNKAVAELEKRINSQNEEIVSLKKELEIKKAVPTPQPIYHIVKSGENLTVIAKKYKVSIKELMKRNRSDIKPDSSVNDGVKLFIKKE